ncbi:sugar kinase [Candidatus Haliotispira prima]|uniref:Sugar kinase n=1 Tax=Candidatus Haliotispira prima TaxID=3034016 RepID=A0ABY8MDL8_9SPIO|nr:sugar kinase [Candidatus Haliotispira prima]
MKKIVTFGEIMGRFETPNHKKLEQSLPGALELTFGGAEANVASSLSYMGKETRFITALPENSLGNACRRFLLGQGIDLSFVRPSRSRLGLYFLETGANQRPGSVTYDRAHSAICNIDGKTVDWQAAFADAEWLHTTGITPSLSRQAAHATLLAVQEAQKAGLTVSCDLNFRKKLWQWNGSMSAKALAQETMRGILPYVDVVIANEEDASDVLGIEAAHSDVSSGQLHTAAYADVAKEIVRQFPNVQQVAITLRESISASHNNWGALLYEDKNGGKAAFAPLDSAANYKPYEIRNMVDRVGGGDSFAAGLIFALTTPELSSPEVAIRYAVAASCLCHSIPGDVNYSTRAEVESLMGGDSSGRVQR